MHRNARRFFLCCGWKYRKSIQIAPELRKSTNQEWFSYTKTELELLVAKQAPALIIRIGFL